MRRAAAIFAVKFQFHGHGVAHLGVRRFADVAMQVKIKTAVANRHEINAPRFFRFAIHAHAHRQRFAPAFLNLRRAPRADEHVGIDVVDFNHRTKSQAVYSFRFQRRVPHDYNFQLSTFNLEPLDCRVPIWSYIIVAVAAYLPGSIPTGFLVAKAKGVDIRKTGSGNIGATNAMRVLGKPAGIFVLLLDALKGVVAVWLGTYICVYSVTYPRLGLDLVPNSGFDGWYPVERFQILAGIFAVLGHNYTCWLKFKGGKGIATTAGVYLALAPIALGIAFIVFILTILVTRYVSVGSIVAAIALPVAVWILAPHNLLLGIVTTALGALAIYKHKSNIQRLMAGTENRLGKKSEDPK